MQVGSDAATKYGGIAQLGERLNGIQEVSGSIPLISTKRKTEDEVPGLFVSCSRVEIEPFPPISLKHAVGIPHSCDIPTAFLFLIELRAHHDPGGGGKVILSIRDNNAARALSGLWDTKPGIIGTEEGGSENERFDFSSLRDRRRRCGGADRAPGDLGPAAPGQESTEKEK